MSSHRACLRSAWGKFLHLEAFTRLSQADQALIYRLLRKNVREAGARRDLVREGDKPRAVNVALEGWACRNKQLPDGRRQVVSFFNSGDLCDSNVFILKEMDQSIGAVPIACRPSREGFGLELLQRVLPYELKADVDLDFRPEGLRVALSMPLT